VQIVIPMSGFGERFRRAGYPVPKPLIEIDGKPIIAHVLDMFPGEHDFIFICNEDHLQNPEYDMHGTLQRLCPNGRVIGIPSHKLGPVHAVQQVSSQIDPDRPVILNYCDFTCLWDWPHFKAFVQSCRCDGAIPAYKGFHPHTLGTTNYAYIREADGRVLDIQEKQPYTDDRMNEYASSGTYYFRSGAVMLDALAEVRRKDLQINGEFYVSLAYKPMLDAGQHIRVYALQHFMQWGTPEDVAEYRGWSNAFRDLGRSVATRPPAEGAVIVPMAGMGQRFAREGYQQTKPLIPVSGRPMVLQATNDLPPAKQHAFVLRADMPGRDDIGNALRAAFPGAVFHDVPTVTEGQACSAELGLRALVDRMGEVSGPITFGACDNGALYDLANFDRLLARDDVDVVVWVARGHTNAIRNPQMFGWVDADGSGLIRGVSVKTPLAQPASDPIVIGTFTFKQHHDFDRALSRLIEQNDRINGEFYLDSTINHALSLGLRCHIFEVDHFFSWGTPNDLRTFEYWQSCFDQWPSHPYAIDQDQRVPPEAVTSLRQRYIWVHPAAQEIAA
jgi:NDP-sugar pyrophosphorylase family protein